jgi:predicted enzyme related to lactoylglutathione lyase
MNQTHTPNHIDYIEFPAANAAAVQQFKAFYAAAFGWAFQDYGPDYADTRSAGVGAGVNGDADHQTQKPLVVIYSTDLSATQAKVQAAGGVITREIFAFPGGQRFHYRDPAGNELAVWSDV